MRTFLSRRYMRPLEWLGKTEIAIGLFILVLLAVIVAAFIYHSSTNKNYLFNASEASLESHELPRASFIAGQLLPDLGDPAWKAADEASVIDAQAAEAIGGTNLAAYGVREAYKRSYATVQEPSLSVDVLVCDAVEPRQAFGLASARRPATAQAASIGHNGWSDPDSSRLGFWNGRYYTELQAKGDTEQAAASLERIARVIADTQLDYGGSFEASDILAAEGASADTLQYFHTSAYGVAGLDEVFAATRPDGIAIWLVDAGSAAGALRVFKTVESAPTQSSGGESYGQPAPAPQIVRKDAVTALVRADDTLAFFTHDSYVRGAHGSDRQATLDAALSIHASLMKSTHQQATAATATVDDSGASPLPDARIASWEAPRSVDRFTAETLYEKIDGRADAYLQFKVVGLVFGTYFNSTDAERTVDVYAYDMGEPANAYGIYKTEASPGAEAVPIGKEGYRTGGAIFFHKGASYIQVLPSDTQDADVAYAVAESIAANIEAEAEQASPADLLPAENRVADSAGYQAQDAFGLSFLSDVYTADYEVDGKRITLFIHQAASPDEARELQTKYEASFTDYGSVLWKDEESGMVAGEAAGIVDVVFVRGRYLGGVTGANDAELAKAQATRFAETFSKQ